ncbi:MAG: AAA family ATPase [Thermoplasmata archaeon]|nr:AAA family ATPase [Thermoplasmata archaeon]
MTDIPTRKPPKRVISSARIAAPARAPSAPKKTFKVQPWRSEGHGEKVIIYADTGMGKTSLSILAPKPVFIGLDDGGKKLKHPVTGEPLNFIPDVVTYQDVRDVLQQPGLFEGYETAVIDTVTILEDLAIPHMLANIPTEKGALVKNIVGYGYNKGFQHLYDLMKFILVDCDALIHKGKNVVLIAQAAPNKVSNPGGEDYLREGPRLYAGKPSIEALYCEWADHILRIDYPNVWSKDKKASGDTTSRVVYTKPEVYFRAKSRTINHPVIEFADTSDGGVWDFMFGKVK